MIDNVKARECFQWEERKKRKKKLLPLLMKLILKQVTG